MDKLFPSYMYSISGKRPVGFMYFKPRGFIQYMVIPQKYWNMFAVYVGYEKTYEILPYAKFMELTQNQKISVVYSVNHVNYVSNQPVPEKFKHKNRILYAFVIGPVFKWNDKIQDSVDLPSIVYNDQEYNIPSIERGNTLYKILCSIDYKWINMNTHLRNSTLNKCENIIIIT